MYTIIAVDLMTIPHALTMTLNRPCLSAVNFRSLPNESTVSSTVFPWIGCSVPQGLNEAKEDLVRSMRAAKPSKQGMLGAPAQR